MPTRPGAATVAAAPISVLTIAGRGARFITFAELTTCKSHFPEKTSTIASSHRERNSPGILSATDSSSWAASIMPRIAVSEIDLSAGVRTATMTRGECLQQILQTAARVTHAVGRLDSMLMEAVGESGERAVNEIVTGRDAGGTGRTQFAAGGS